MKVRHGKKNCKLRNPARKDRNYRGGRKINRKLNYYFVFQIQEVLKKGKALEDFFLPFFPLCFASFSFFDHPGAPELGFPFLWLLLGAKP